MMKTIDVFVKTNELTGLVNIEVTNVKTIMDIEDSDVFSELLNMKEYLKAYGFKANVIGLK